MALLSAFRPEIDEFERGDAGPQLLAHRNSPDYAGYRSAGLGLSRFALRAALKNLVIEFDM